VEQAGPAAAAGGAGPAHGRPPHLPAKADYAVRALLLLAERAPARVKLGELSADQQLPRKFTETILRELRRHGFVRSRRGADGGHALARPASEITLGAVVRSVAGAPAAGYGSPLAEPAYRGASAHLPDVWSAMDASMRRVLDGTTLEQVLHGTLPADVDRLAREAVRDPGRRPAPSP
jgi:Rrf2 family protein